MDDESTGSQNDLEGVDTYSMVGGSTSCLVHLKTASETQARDSIIDVYITAIPVKKASGALNLIRTLIPNDGGLDLQHLRRFAKHADVPELVRTSIMATQTQLKCTLENGSEERLLVVGSTNMISKQDIMETLSSIINPAPICSIPVPLLAPTSQEQAVFWSSKYWPTVYKKSNPFGPHPSIVSRAEQEIRGDTERWMNLAALVAREASTTGSGEEIGAVIVERRNGIGRPIATAGDARWLDWPVASSGNVTAHAALRAIAMVAEGLKLREKPLPSAHIAEKDCIFRDQPLGAVEREYHHPPSEDGYLCHNLEIYCTHEPCVMCSMAIVHSRFGRVIFGRRMPSTGGLHAGGELGHGLFWRKELNWTLLAWHWAPDSVSPHGSFNGHA